MNLLLRSLIRIFAPYLYRMITRKLSYICLILSLLLSSVAPLRAELPSEEGIRLPYRLNSWSEELFAGLIVKDANNDDATWELYTLPDSTMTVRYHYHVTHPADDYLYFPAMRLQKDSCYTATLYLHAGAEEYAEEFSAYITQADAPYRKTCCLGTKIAVTGSQSSEYTFTFCPPDDSLYRLALHCSSAANRYMLYIDSLAIDAIGSAFVPDSVTNLRLQSVAENRNKVQIVCTTPSQYLNGEPLTEIEALHIFRNDSLIRTFDHPLPGTLLCDTDSVSVIDRYRYTVVAKGSDGLGIPVSRNMIVGACEVPFHQDFIDGIGFCNIVDNNHDNTTWHHYTERFTGCMRYMSSPTADADDWIITPPVYLSDTTRYEVRYSCCVGLSYYPETMRVLLSRSAEALSFSTVIDELQEFTFINDTVVVAPFSVAVAGHYYIGFQAKSTADSYAILLRNIGVDIYDDTAVHAVKLQRHSIGGAQGKMTAQCSEATDIAIYDLSGRLIGSRHLSAGYSEIPLSAGVYIVKAGKEVGKIIVW